MKFLIARFVQESNSFSAENSDMDAFVKGGIFEGDEMLAFSKRSNIETTGFYDVLHEAGAQIVPSVAMRSINSCGFVEDEPNRYFLDRLTRDIQNSMPLDGVLLSYHGATLLRNSDDGLGDVAQTVRSLIGAHALLAVTTDYHANVTEKAVKHADYICGYQTYPHIDFYETGARAARLCVASCRENARFYMAQAKLPLLLQAEASQTTTYPMREVMDHARRVCGEDGLLDYSVYQMQPWLDVYEGGSAVLTVARDRDKAISACRRIAQKYWEVRRDIVYKLEDMDRVIDTALANGSRKPVIMSDSADSPSAGATGDSTEVLSRLLERRVDIPVILTVVDKEVPLEAERVGVGGRGVFFIGGKVDTKRFQPVRIEAYVKAIHDGNFVFTGGLPTVVGKTVILQCGSLTILCFQKPCYHFDPCVYLAFGIDPAQASLVVCKSATQYRAHYAPYSDLMYTIDTPGAASANLHTFEFKHLPRPIFPFEEAEYTPDHVVVARGK